VRQHTFVFCYFSTCKQTNKPKKAHFLLPVVMKNKITRVNQAPLRLSMCHMAFVEGVLKVLEIISSINPLTT
jgi:hypothetical protein